MSLRLRFNLILMLVSLAGLVIAAWVSWQVISEHAEEEVTESANVLLSSAQAVRSYTVEEVRPVVNRLEDGRFHPQTVPAYAATRFVRYLQKDYPEYDYREAALNPTNPEHRALDWEADVIEWFRDHPEAKELKGLRQGSAGRLLYISHPIRITNPACLACHDTPDKAPPAVVARYGRDNGFGWKLGEVIGAQIVTVPAEYPLQRARREFLVFMGGMVLVFLAVAVALNLLLHYFVIRRVARIAGQAEAMSTSLDEVEELPVHGRDEISSLARSFNRMVRSLRNAMKLLRESGA